MVAVPIFIFTIFKEDAENTGQCNKEILSKEDCQNAQESYQRNQKMAKDYQGLSGVGQFGYVSSIALGVLTGVAGAAGIISYAALGGPALALALGIPGLVFGIVFTPLSAGIPSSFHEGFGATLLTPLALGWGLLSGPISVISRGWGTLPSFGSKNKTVDSYFKALHTAGEIAGTAATLAAAGTMVSAGGLALAGSSLIIPIASSLVSAITPIGAIAAGSIVVGGGLAWGIKELAIHVTQNSKIAEIADFKSKSTLKKDRNYWQQQIKFLDQDKIKQLHQEVLSKKQAEEKLKAIYGPGSLAHGAKAVVPYNIPEIVTHQAHLENPQAAGLTHYGAALEPQKIRPTLVLSPQGKKIPGVGAPPQALVQGVPLFSLWGPSLTEADRRGLDVPIKGDYAEKRNKDRLHRGSDFVAPPGNLNRFRKRRPCSLCPPQRSQQLGQYGGHQLRRTHPNPSFLWHVWAYGLEESYL